MEWVTSTLSDISVIQSGSGFPKKYQGLTDEEYPFYKVSDMNLLGNEESLYFENNTISSKTRSTLKTSLFPVGSIIFPKVGAAIATNKKRILTKIGCVDNNVMGVIPNESKIDSRFLYYWFQQQNLSEFANEAALPSIKKTTVEKWPVSYPDSILEQKRIVSILDTVFADLEQARAKTEQNLKNARELMNVTFHGAITGKLTKQWREANKGIVTASELLVQLKEQKKNLVSEKSISKEKALPEISDEEVSYELPETWKWCRLGEIGNAINYPFVDGPFGSSINTKKDYLEAGIPVLRMVNVKPFTFKNYNLKYVSEDKYQQFTRHNVLPGDVLFSKVGAGTGESCVVPDDFSYGMLSTTGITRIRVGQLVLNQYLCCFLNSNIEKFMVLASKAAQPFLNMTQIKTFPFPLPPIEEQREIVLIIERLSTEIQKVEAIYEKKLLALDELKKSILQKAFSGELTHD